MRKPVSVQAVLADNFGEMCGHFFSKEQVRHKISHYLLWISHKLQYIDEEVNVTYQLAWPSLKFHQILTNLPRLLLHSLICVSVCLSVLQPKINQEDKMLNISATTGWILSKFET